MRLLLLEDDVILKDSIEEFLSAQNYNVDSFENSEDAYDAIFSVDYDLLLLDVNIPGEFNGFSLRKALADENKNIPTIFVTSMSSADALIQGYAHGCCDYIKKPFDLTELMLRVRHALKSNCFKTQEEFLILPDDYRYNVTTYELTCNGVPVSLSKTESEILNLFLMNRNRVLTLEMLYEKIWENNVDAANARVQINNLRRKLPKNLIKNIYGLGYRLDCR
ncbi:response regulator transcription factor [Sulfuricurvum sp.]|uniref:response regulator transcription factor n=1 Tax=Sulfuricurvum sp. TaxID=2025608 RepID=UPI002634CE3F|nr:response regulator transcription factor [Sulfuricurvum sp.]MDD2266859.1 response regulator transcription factor [Sulfuricurvum sp.]MDD2783836.1 response regulator transcription factor [Sulfuricurvum sp.]